MDHEEFIDSFDVMVDDALFWVSDHAAFLFDAVRDAFDGFYGLVLAAVQLPPFWALALLIGLLAWRAAGWGLGVLSVAGIVICWAMGLYPQTVETLALVLSASLIALLIALPVGVAVGYLASLDKVFEPVLDLIQTMPPYIYLLPTIALLGYGAATALTATVIVTMPPVIRLTALGIRNTPNEFIELGRASGIGRAAMFWKIRLPFALPSIMAGINQGLMMAFGMVVIAGIVGSGGLGKTIYDAIRTLDIASSINGAIAIVILTMIIDRITQGFATATREDR